MQQAQLHAGNKGGSCLSNEYIGSREKLEWKCQNPHHPAWFASFDGVINKKSWCRLCGIEHTGQNRK